MPRKLKRRDVDVEWTLGRVDIAQSAANKALDALQAAKQRQRVLDDADMTQSQDDARRAPVLKRSN